MIFFKKCPCCRENIVVWSPKPCKCIENYKCYYCPKCNKQITPQQKVKKDNQMLNIVISGVVLFVIKLYEVELLEIIVLILLVLFVSLLYAIMKGLTRYTECIKDDCDNKEIVRDNSDLWGSDMPFMKMDSIEKKNMENIINYSLGLGGYVLIAFVVLSVIVSSLKYIFG